MITIMSCDFHLSVCLFIDVFCLNDMAAMRVDRHMVVFPFFFSLLIFARPHGTTPSESGFCQRFAGGLSCSAIEDCPFQPSHITRALLPCTLRGTKGVGGNIKVIYTDLV